jgi:uncharacterized membrane protein
MESGIGLLILLVLLVLIGGPILAIVAFVRAGNLQKTAEQLPRLTARIYDLEQRLEALDRRLRSGAAPETPPPRPATAPVVTAKPAEPAMPPRIPGTQAPPPSQPAPPTAQVPPSAPPIPAAPRFSPLSVPSAPHTEADVESVIAGKWMYYVGILALVFAVAYFLKYAFDNNWIGPWGRISIGGLIGAAMFPLSDWLLHRGYRYFSEGITGFGAAVLYLSIWAGWHYYSLFPQSTAFGLMIVVTATTAGVALGRDSQRIAALALLGGALTPVLVSTGRNQEVALFSYLAILGAGMLVLAFRRNWKWIPPLQFAATLVYFWGWYATFYADGALGTTLVFATIFFALFAALPAVRSLRAGELSGEEIGVVLANAFQFLGALRLMLWPEYRWGLTLAVLALAAVHLLAERALPRKNTQASRAASMIYAGLALVFATLAIPIRLDGKWITIAWAVEGALLVWSGLRVRALALRTAGMVLLAVVGIRLVAFPFQPGPTFLLNERFLTLALCAGCFLAVFLFARRSDTELGPPETQIYYALAIAANLCFLVALSLDVWDLYGRMPSLGIDRSLAQNLALSVLWLVYALALLGGGAIKDSAALRWQALALLGVVIVKVFFFDLSFLARFYRIVSFLLLGLVLLFVSFFYQRRSKTSEGAKGP